MPSDNTSLPLTCIAAGQGRMPQGFLVAAQELGPIVASGGSGGSSACSRDSASCSTCSA